MRIVARELRAARDAARIALCLMLVMSGFVIAPTSAVRATTATKAAEKSAPTTTAATAQRGSRMITPEPAPQPTSGQVGRTYEPKRIPVKSFPAIHLGEAARQEALGPAHIEASELKAIDPPKGRPEWFENRGNQGRGGGDGGGGGDEITIGMADEAAPQPQLPTPSAQGSSPGPHKTFKGEFLTGSTIPPDTMGAVGTNHVMSVSNNQIRIHTRDGVQLVRMTLNAFWAGVTLEGGITTPSTFDPKVFYDRAVDKYFFFTSANSTSPASSVLLAITQGNNPTGTWDRYVFDADPTATSGPGGSGKWADYPTIGFNKNWIVANYNVFNYACNGAGVCATTGYAGPYIYVMNKGDAYDGGTLTDVDLFTDTVANCVSPFNGILGCGFTMAPSVAEDNTSETLYFVEDWDSVFGQLRVSKLTGTAAAPVLTVGTQFPQSTENWRFNAARIGTGGVAGASGG
ncbi:MAG TPA: hypothetical protein VFX96_02465, partial [Pyrinomonadaceae bacterium]|nr:hypothetical protein [Pyrinomonadaceae bacterium]